MKYKLLFSSNLALIVMKIISIILTSVTFTQSQTLCWALVGTSWWVNITMQCVQGLYTVQLGTNHLYSPPVVHQSAPAGRGGHISPHGTGPVKVLQSVSASSPPPLQCSPSWQSSPAHSSTPPPRRTVWWCSERARPGWSYLTVWESKESCSRVIIHHQPTPPSQTTKQRNLRSDSHS